MLLQDVTMFIGINNNTVHFTKYFIDSMPPLYQFLLIPPGWSIGLEISFYLMAPWILKKKNIYILSIICISLITRIILQFNGFIGDSWSYRFFPSELAVFLIGSQAFYIYTNQEINEKKSWLSQLLYLYIILIIITFPFIPIEPQLKKLLFYCLFALSLGKIFDLTKDNKLDKLIVLLSYPIYCCHLIVLYNILPAISYWADNGTFLNTLVTFITVIIISFLIYFFIEKPIEYYRKRYKTHNLA